MVGYGWSVLGNLYINFWAWGFKDWFSSYANLEFLRKFPQSLCNLPQFEALGQSVEDQGRMVQ